MTKVQKTKIQKTQAQQTLQQEQPQTVIAIDASSEHHALLSSWREKSKKRRQTNGKLSVTIEGNKMYLIEHGQSVQLELVLPTDDGTQGAIIAGIKNMFQAEGLRNWAALLRLWSVEGGRTSRVRWTLDEHLAALGYTPQQQRKQELRDRISRLVESFTRLELVLFDDNGKERYRAPLIQTKVAREVKVEIKVEEEQDEHWRVEGMVLQANDALFSGVRNFETGGIGSNWWPISPEFPQIDHKAHPYAIGMGLLLAIRWRWAMNNQKDHIALIGENLARIAGAPTDKHNQERILAAIERDLVALQKFNVVEKWEWEGSPSLESLVRIWPSQWSANIAWGRTKIVEEKSEPEVPITGEELKAWRKRKNLTQVELADRLRISERTLRDAENKEKLPMAFIAKLRTTNIDLPRAKVEEEETTVFYL